MNRNQMILEAINRGLLKAYADGTVISTRPNKRSKDHLGVIHRQTGYVVTSLYLDGLRKQVTIHRVVWIYFFGLPMEGQCVDHINRNKSDNRISNLRLVDAKLNAINRRCMKGDNSPTKKVSDSQVREIRSLKGLMKAKDIAEKFGVTKSLVNKIHSGKARTSA